MGRCVVIAAFIMIAATSVLAGEDADRLGIGFRERVELGRELPAILVRPGEDVAMVKIAVVAGERVVKRFAKRVAANQGIECSWKQPAGKVDYSAQFVVNYANGDKAKFRVSFSVAAQPPLRVQIPRSEINMDERTLKFTQSRAAAKAELQVFGPTGDVVSKKEFEFKGEAAGTKLALQWDAFDGALGKLALKAYDADGFWAGVEVTPFTVNIPHDEVEFETGSDVIRAAEAPKLEKTWSLLREALEKHKDDVELKLYIAGYTDTVGGAEYNLGLSERRARSIARWFKRRVKIPVLFQGFGKSVLAVETPDQTAEPRNRRALYLLSNMPPAASSAIPKQNWKSVR